MAFCKYCGKEIPEGDSCTCPGAIHEENAKAASDISDSTSFDVTEGYETIQDEVSDVSADTALYNAEDTSSAETAEPLYIPEDTDTAPSDKENSRTEDIVYSPVSDTEQNVNEDNTVKQALDAAKAAADSGPSIRKAEKGPYVKKSSDDTGFIKFAALVAAVLLIFIVIVLSAAAGSGYRGTVKKYFSSRYSKHGGKTYYSLTLPDEGIKELKNEDMWRDIIEDYNDDVEDRMDDWEKKPKFRKISRVKDMKNAEIKNAEKYFCNAAEACGADIDEDDIEIKKGYSVIYRYKNTEGDNEKTTVYVVKIKGEGWKVMSDQTTSFSGFDK